MSLQVDSHEGMVDDDVFGTIVDVVSHLLIQCRNGRTMIGMLWWWLATTAAAAAPPPYGVEIMMEDALDVERVPTFYYIFVSVSIIIILCILLYY